jgi:hypothetical protein
MTTDTTIVRHVAFGSQRVSRSIVPRARLDAGGTRLRLRALHVMGHGSACIARALRTSEDTIQRLVRGDARTVSPQLRDAVADLYDAWWDKRAPERTRAETWAAFMKAPRTTRSAPISTATSSGGTGATGRIIIARNSGRAFSSVLSLVAVKVAG